jgi:SAM-dependent methyltransferase
MNHKYETYLRGEWDLFWQQPKRFEIARGLASRLAVKRVLDIGCGAGQELYPYLGPEVLGVGVDIAPDVGLFVRSHPPPRPVGDRDPVFVRAAAERLPFLSNHFDVIVCRIVLPCVDNKAALTEMARVLSHNGMVVLRIHAVGYYFQKIATALRRGRLRTALGAIRPLLTGAAYHVLGVQLGGRETFQSRWLLQRELQRLGLTIESTTSNSAAASPTYVITRFGTHAHHGTP